MYTYFKRIINSIKRLKRKLPCSDLPETKMEKYSCPLDINEQRLTIIFNKFLIISVNYVSHLTSGV